MRHSDMKLSKIRKKQFSIALGLLIILALTNLSVSIFVKHKIVNILAQNILVNYTASVDDIDFNLVNRSLTFTRVKFVPKAIAVSNLIENKGNGKSLENITLSSLSLKGISIFRLIVSKEISINTISFNDLFIRKIENSTIFPDENETIDSRKSINIDSLYIKKLGGLNIKNLAFVNFKYQIFDVTTSEITFQNSPINFNSSGIKLVKVSQELFQLSPSQETFEIKNIDIDFNKKKYNLKLKKLVLDFNNKIINLSDLSFKPTISKFELAQKHKYNHDVFDVDLEELSIYNFNLAAALKSNAILLDSILVRGLDLKLFKDKRKQFNQNKYVALPHLKLQKLNTKIHIPAVSIIESNIVLEEQLEDIDTLFRLSINDINAKIQNITTLPKFKESPLKLTISGKLMNYAPLNLTINLPLKNGQETFLFSGELGKSEFEIYDNVLYPVLGLKILSGEIDLLRFNAKADNTSSSGTMTMQYHNLKTSVFKSNSLKRNKFLSWSLNHVVRKSNPNKNGNLKVTEMNSTRNSSKGLGNYIWKTLQSGIVNTISPTGKSVKKN
jgi:hypothetical protein